MPSAALKKESSRSPALSVTTMEKAVSTMQEIGSQIRKAIQLETARDQKIAEIENEFNPKINAAIESAKNFARNLFGFVLPRREELLAVSQGKTISIPNAGSCRFYTTPDSVIIEDEDATIKELKDLGYPEFIRTKEEVNKEALGDHPEIIEKLTGVSLQNKEKFCVDPPRAQATVVCDVSETPFFSVVFPQRKK